ncbi:MAG: PAS domain S-box protein, partial [Actinobacteria bacterium]|nr:PAS domain S-box protein [Actinomycetota bacterium]
MSDPLTGRGGRSLPVQGAGAAATGTTDPSALAAERDVLATIVDTAPIGILIADPANRVLRVNAAFCAVVGRTPAELAGVDLLTLVHPEDVGFDILARERLLEGGDDTLRRTSRYLRPDGTPVVVDISTTLVRGENGPRFFVSEVRDITAERDAEEERDRIAAQLRTSERRFRALATSAPACLFETDSTGACVWVNERWQEITGRSDESAVGFRWLDAIHPEDVARVQTEWRTSVLRRTRFAGDFRFVRPDGSVRWVTASAAPLPGDEEDAPGALGVIVDITETKRVEERLRDTEELFRRSFEDAPIGMVLAAADGTVARANDALAGLLGYDIAAVWMLGLYGLFDTEDGEEIRAEIGRLIAEDLAAIATELRLLRADGTHLWAQVAASLVKDAEGSVHVLVQMQDITERRRYEEQLRWMADHDALTGLANRRRLEQELDRQLKLVERYGPRGSLLLFDLDHFKAVNDALGHAAGDELLVAVADILRDRLRETDLAARLGGDEFAVLIPEGDDTDARVVAEAICTRVREHAAALCGGQPFRVSASVGVVLFADSDATTPEELLASADLALYDVKGAGRDGFAFYDRDRHEQDRDRTTSISWGQEIRDALAEDRLVLDAQPICNVLTGEV